jgi:hypothetical protein
VCRLRGVTSVVAVPAALFMVLAIAAALLGLQRKLRRCFSFLKALSRRPSFCVVVGKVEPFVIPLGSVVLGPLSLRASACSRCFTGGFTLESLFGCRRRRVPLAM